MLPMIIKNTRLSFLTSALMTVLLSGNMVVQFHMVLGDTSPIFVPTRTASSPRSHSSTCPRHKTVAWAGLSRHDRQKQGGLGLGPFGFSQTPISKEHSSAAPFVDRIEYQNPSFVPNRRHFLGSLATGAIASQLNSVNLAYAAENNTTDAVDWDSFGTQLQKSQFTPSAPGFPASGNGGSDLDRALKDSSKRKLIDPRTHG